MNLLIGIPSYNKPELISKAISSLQKQNFSNYKVIISDDSDEGPARIIEKFISKLDDNRFSYKKNEKRKGLFGNMKYLWGLAYAHDFDLFMWLCDDDEMFGSNFLKDAIEFLSSNDDCAVAGYPCKRHLNGEFWYRYEDISTVGLTRKERVSLMLNYMKSNPNIFETLQYGIHRLANCPKYFEIGYRKSIIAFFVIVAFNHSVHTVEGPPSVKNTDDANIEGYKGIKHNNKKLPHVFRILPLGMFVRLRILYHAILSGNINLIPWLLTKLY